jgi:predicted nucleic acid-binding protein
MKCIADTGSIVAFGNRDDGHHAWAIEVAGKITEPPLTCEAVLAEAACRRHDPIDGIAERYRDQRPDLADLCIIRMSELHPKHTVTTTDQKDFRVYRRNKREAIQILCPPGRR